MDDVIVGPPVALVRDRTKGRARAFRGLAERASGLPLRWQIGTLVVVGLIGVFTLFGLLGAAIANDAKERTVSGWLGITRSVAASIDSELAREYGRLEWMAARVGVTPDTALQRDILTGALWNDGSLVSAAMLLDAAGHGIWSTGPRSALLGAAVRLGRRDRREATDRGPWRTGLRRSAPDGRCPRDRPASGPRSDP